MGAPFGARFRRRATGHASASAGASFADSRWLVNSRIRDRVLASGRTLTLKQIAPILLSVSDMQTKFYTYTRLYAGYNFETNQPLDPYLVDWISAFLQSY